MCISYAKSSIIIIKNAKECHCDTPFEYDLHFAVHDTNSLTLHGNS